MAAAAESFLLLDFLPPEEEFLPSEKPGMEARTSFIVAIFLPSAISFAVGRYASSMSPLAFTPPADDEAPLLRTDGQAVSVEFAQCRNNQGI